MADPKVLVLISGNGSNLQALIDACERDDFNIQLTAVISSQSDALGLHRAKDAGIATQVLTAKQYPVRQDYDRALAKAIDSYDVDLIVMAGFMRILTEGFVQHFEGRILNIHPSLLPRYQGLHTHQRALDAGDEEHGCSVHFVTPELDGGPLVLQAKVPVFEDDTAESLALRVQVQEHQIYPLVMRWFCEGRLQMEDEQAWLDGHKLSESGYAQD